MPTRKQRKRRQKGRRHDYEYVYVDDEGNELDPEEAAALQPASPERSPASRNGRAKPRAVAQNTRIQPPSWARVAKRGAIFAPLMFITVMFLDSKLGLVQVAIQTLLLMAIFLPFSYFLDSFMYSRYQRRIGGPDPRAKR
jgi:hypothetical protein